MKKQIIILSIAAGLAATGCTSFKRDASGFQYRNGFFSKQFSKATYEHAAGVNPFGPTNLYRVEIEGYKSDAAQTVEALVNGMLKLMQAAPVAAVKAAK
jgi:hypothetical protein